MYTVFNDTTQTEERHLVLEPARFGTLYSFVRLHGQVFREVTLYAVLSQLTEALTSIHEAGILHSDIKDSNVLIVCGSEMNPCSAGLPITFKMADFGVSLDLSTIESMNKNVAYKRGTQVFWAPEQWDKKWAPKKLSRLQKVDVFQLGVLLFRMIFKAYPFRYSTGQDPNLKNPTFLEEFLTSERNHVKS